jgi:hypothetical protein
MRRAKVGRTEIMMENFLVLLVGGEPRITEAVGSSVFHLYKNCLIDQTGTWIWHINSSEKPPGAGVWKPKPLCRTTFHTLFPETKDNYQHTHTPYNFHLVKHPNRIKSLLLLLSESWQRNDTGVLYPHKHTKCWLVPYCINYNQLTNTHTHTYIDIGLLLEH